MLTQAIEVRLVIVMGPNPEPNDNALIVHCTNGPVAVPHFYPPDDAERVPKIELQISRIRLKDPVASYRLRLDLRRELLEGLPEIRIAPVD